MYLLLKVGKIKDGARTVSRTIQTNFFDGAKQEAIDLLLVGDFQSDDYAEKGRMLMDSSALLGNTGITISIHLSKILQVVLLKRSNLMKCNISKRCYCSDML